MSRRTLLALLGAFALLAGAVLPATMQPATAQAAPAEPVAQAQTVTLRYGPYTIPKAANGEHGELPNQIAVDVAKPCESCFVTGFKPNLVYADGSNANINTGPMLHHAVIFNSAAWDTVCGGSRRVLASGNERMESVFPAGYGFRMAPLDRWTLLADLMNHAHEEKTVYVQFTFTYQPVLGSHIRPVIPLWLDAGGCLDSTWDVPAGQQSEKSRTWRSTVSGDLVHIRGHLHHGGVAVQTEDVTTGRLFCRSEAEEGGTPEFIDHHGMTEVSNMPSCSGSPIGRINFGDTLKITASYKASDEGFSDVMGIMHGWVTEG
ncbi:MULTISPECIES: hypothetical protein [unclassified Actinomadura]|uniref:hypothetical protein n=1 Tax=unclassified Actinomadura TaxID=2626254 RepID=UPI0011EF7908|nr:hypothetical protein [Actinomadura sp. K4S16]